MIKRILFILTLAALFPLSRSYAQTAPPAQSTETNNLPGWHKMTPEQCLEKFSDKLALTEEQKPKVKAIFDAWHADMMTAKTNAETQLEAVLTPEQYQKFQTMMEHKKHQMHHMHGGGGMEGGTEDNGTNEDENTR